MLTLEIPAKSRLLAAYAQPMQTSHGREHIEEPQNFYDEWTFDRAKILSSRSFELLGAKAIWDHPAAQNVRWLALNNHTAALAQQIARALHCNEDLTQTCVLVTNLGRPPAAYEGWRALSWMMSTHGGYNPQHQALRVVDEIEISHPEYNGLNLSWETRESLVHGGINMPRGVDPVLGFAPLQTSLEASIAAHAHRIAYVLCGLSTALYSGVAFPEMFRESTLWQMADTRIARSYKRLEERRRIPLALAYLRDALVADIIKTSRSIIEADEPASADAVRQSEKKYISHSSAIAEELPQLEDSIIKLLNHDPERLRGRQRRIERLITLFRLLVQNTTLLGPHAHQRLRKESPHRVVCDFLCLFTDDDLRRMQDELLIESTPQIPLQPALSLG